MQAKIKWTGETVFEAATDSGSKLTFDSSSDPGSRGPSPMEALLCSLASCAAMDVVSILVKKRQTVHSYRVEASGDRPPAGVWPRPFTKINLKHVLAGQNLDPLAVARAVELSEKKYCSVAATLRSDVEIDSEWTIEES